MAIIKRLIAILVLVSIPLALGLLFTYDIIKIDWISNMEIQPSFKTNEDPLPLPPRSIPVQGASFIPEVGAPPDNPIDATEENLKAGQRLYTINCALCHGTEGKGDGPFAPFLVKVKPADLVSADSPARNLSDGAIFLIITNGVEGAMPPMHENLPEFTQRWDVVNYVRQLQGQ